MTNEEQEKLIEQIKKEIREEYFLVKKNNWFSFLGGAVAFIFLVGISGYKGSIRAINKFSEELGTTKINNLVKAIETKELKANELIKKIDDTNKNAENFYRKLESKESKHLSKIDSKINLIESQQIPEINNKINSMNEGLSITKTRAKKFNDFLYNYNNRVIYPSKPKYANNTKHIWVEETDNSIVLGGLIKLRGDTGNDAFLIRNYPKGNVDDKDKHTRISYPKIRVETGRDGEAELVINGDLTIENGSITIDGKEIKTK